MINIISVIGVNGSGKDYFLGEIKKKLKGYTFHYDFSDGVREYTFAFLGYTPLFKDYEAFKINQFNICGKIKTGREFLDNVGGKMREFDSNFWVNHTINKAKRDYQEYKVSNFIFGSCRYINEAIGILNLRDELNKVESVNLKFYFCDYRSNKYNDTPKEYQKLSLLLRDEYKCTDGEDVTELILKLINNERT